ncbi:BL37 [Listeria grayi]|uniref:Large ribosomal subunit protein bL32 n=1 Tax=Listeria grayi FSL F6-1183 TaxID=1265827 RepID=A0A829R3S1_LISGR|nr:50S ribosomal protein L32 [Listeria grayi]EUJ25838.1 50S ribosomal protein L32 [Listeria grayi FSL F6-1183]MBC1921614.1 50S ribosomal protein L32 [Listeria grayi]VEI31409.1 BL37 [Listeria grayi]
MAVPARKTSKAKKRKRRGNKKLTAPAIHYNKETGEYEKSHHISPSGTYKGEQIL